MAATLQRVAPIFPVRDVAQSLAHYQRLGFATRLYGTGEYGFATRDDIELHLGIDPAGTGGRTTAYVWVDDADALAAEWRAAGAEVHGPEDTEWGQHEGALVDPDDNVIRFGSPIGTPA
jgi:catechol 2,3-dioxygenase-like lactoylglutathione lyase family enzyme